MHAHQWTPLDAALQCPKDHISQCPGMMEPLWGVSAILTPTFSALPSLSLSTELFITSWGESWGIHRQQFVFTKAVGSQGASVSFTDGQLSCRETEIKPFCAGFRPAFGFLGCSFNFFHKFILIFMVLSAAFDNLCAWGSGLQVRLMGLWNPQLWKVVSPYKTSPSILSFR